MEMLTKNLKRIYSRWSNITHWTQQIFTELSEAVDVIKIIIT